jgi:hypothetical protein
MLFGNLILLTLKYFSFFSQNFIEERILDEENVFCLLTSFPRSLHKLTNLKWNKLINLFSKLWPIIWDVQES